MPKRVNPYTRLKLIASKYINEVKYRRVIKLWWYAKKDLNIGYSLDGLYHRVLAAKDLDYSVELRADEKGLHVVYVRNPPRVPWELQ